MFAWPLGWVIVVVRLAPFVREVFAPVVALNVGLNLSELQLPTVIELDSESVPVAVVEPSEVNPVNVESVLSTPQLVGFSRKPCLLIETLMFFSRSGMPL